MDRDHRSTDWPVWSAFWVLNRWAIRLTIALPSANRKAVVTVKMAMFIVAVFSLALIGASPVILLAQSVKTEDRVPIFVRAAGDGDFTDPSKDRQDSVKDVLNRIKDSKVVRLTTEESEAAAIIEVLGRQTNREVNFFGAQNKSYLAVKLMAGEYSTEFQGESGSSGIFKDYKGAAKSVVKQLEDWVKANRSKLPKK